MIPLPIANGSYESESLPISAQSCINWYANIVQTQGLSEETLFGTPGINQLATSGTKEQVNRGSGKIGATPYFINGTTLWRLNKAGVDVEVFDLELMGTIPGEKRVFTATNGTQLMIVTEGRGWIFTEDPDSLVEILAGSFTANGTPETVEFISSYFVCTTDQKKAIISAQNDGTSWNALDFISAEADPDPLSGLVAFKNQLFLMGTETTQVAAPIATSGVPLQIQPGYEIAKGLSAPHSVVVVNDSIMFIGAGKNESPAIWVIQGGAVQKVSTTAIDTKLQNFSADDIESSFAIPYAQKGAYFINFYLPDTCFSFNTITGRWNEIQSDIVDIFGNVQTIRSRVNTIITGYGRVLVADSQDGRVGEMSPEFFTEYGESIKRTLVTQPFSNNGFSFSVNKLEATFEAGVGDSITVNPVVRMSRSKDGKTFSDERSRFLGKRGEYNKRSIWPRLGRVGRFELFKFVFSDPVKPAFIKLEADIKQGNK